MKTRSPAATAAFTLIETIIYAAMGCIVSFVAYSALRSSAVLSVKNTNLNRSHDDLRSAYDRLGRHLLSANYIPTLVDTAGAKVSSGTAAGVSIDKTVGGPYIITEIDTAPNAAGALAPTDTEIYVWRSKHDLATAPVPKAGEIMLIPTFGGNIRASISQAQTKETVGTLQKVRLILTGPVNKSLTWAINEPQAGTLLKPEGFLVIGGELRYYPTFSPLPALNNSANYKVLTDQLSTVSGEQTPFEVKEFSGDRFLTSTLRVRERKNAAWIAGDEANSYNTYFQLHVNLPSRFRPRTTN